MERPGCAGEIHRADVHKNSDAADTIAASTIQMVLNGGQSWVVLAELRRQLGTEGTIMPGVIAAGG